MCEMNLKNENLYYIGGIVRDELLGLKSLDIDLTYQGNAIEFAKNLPEIEILQINEPFGTVKIKLADKEIDIASTRSESYPQKGHLPKVSNIGCSLKEDILRRDFTINALAKSTLTGEIVDYTGGLNDIKNKTLRILHDKSFIDDPTRILRALKFSTRFGFDLDAHTQQLQKNYLQNINYDMSYKRLKKELIETFNLNSQTAFEKFINEGIYKLISPLDFPLPTINLENLISKYKPSCPWIIYVGLLPDISNLPLTKLEKKIVDDFNVLKQNQPQSYFEIYKNFEKLNLESILMYSTIDKVAVKNYLETLRHIKIQLTGKDLQKLGIQPSKSYQDCFDFVLKAKLLKPELTKAEELELAKDYFGG